MELYSQNIKKTGQIERVCFNSTRELVDAYYQNSDPITFWGKKLELVDESKNLWEMRDGSPKDS